MACVYIKAEGPGFVLEILEEGPDAVAAFGGPVRVADLPELLRAAARRAERMLEAEAKR